MDDVISLGKETLNQSPRLFKDHIFSMVGYTWHPQSLGSLQATTGSHPRTGPEEKKNHLGKKKWMVWMRMCFVFHWRLLLFFFICLVFCRVGICWDYRFVDFLKLRIGSSRIGIYIYIAWQFLLATIIGIDLRIACLDPLDDENHIHVKVPESTHWLSHMFEDLVMILAKQIWWGHPWLVTMNATNILRYGKDCMVLIFRMILSRRSTYRMNDSIKPSERFWGAHVDSETGVGLLPNSVTDDPNGFHLEFPMHFSMPVKCFPLKHR